MGEGAALTDRGGVIEPVVEVVVGEAAVGLASGKRPEREGEVRIGLSL